MFHLLLQLDGDRYAPNVAQIVEVLPLAATRLIPGTPAWMVGVIERCSAPASAIDVPQLALGHPTRPLRSTHLVLVYHETGIRGDDTPLLGLVLEHATHIRHIDDANFATGGIATPNIH